MNWKNLDNIDELNVIIKESFNKPQLIFKHSTRCIISKMALRGFEMDFDFEDRVTPHYLDLIAFRNISDKVSEMFNVVHQSPQILLIREGEAVYSESHEGISAEELNKRV